MQYHSVTFALQLFFEEKLFYTFFLTFKVYEVLQITKTKKTNS